MLLQNSKAAKRHRSISKSPLEIIWHSSTIYRVWGFQRVIYCQKPAKILLLTVYQYWLGIHVADPKNVIPKHCYRIFNFFI